MPTCRHRSRYFTWRDDNGESIAITYHYPSCGAQLSLGPSSDDDPAVQVEMRAAEKIASIAEDLGGESDIWGDDRATTFSGGPWHDKFNESLWPWDPTRPLAGQYEAYVAHMAIGDAMLEETLAEEEPRIDGILTATETSAVSAAEDAMRNPEVTAEANAEHKGDAT